MQDDARRSEAGVAYRDLNGDGRMDPYEDPRRPVAERVEDLVGRMTLEEKAGLLFHTMSSPRGTGFPDMQSAEELIRQKHRAV